MSGCTAIVEGVMEVFPLASRWSQDAGLSGLFVSFVEESGLLSNSQLVADSSMFPG